MKNSRIGGMAVLEGVMLRSPLRAVVVVKGNDGTFHRKVLKEYKESGGWGRVPFFRGIVLLVDTLAVGYSALSFSSRVLEEREEKGRDGNDTFALFVSLLIALLLFLFLPTWLAGVSGGSALVKNFVESGIRLGVFALYVVAIGFIPDVKRVFEYHGAEHKVVNAWERVGKEVFGMGVEKFRKFPRLHRRCGTTFIFFVVFVATFFHAAVGWPGLWQRLLFRLLLLPVIVGVSYEILKLADVLGWFGYIIASPGLAFQYLTVREPDEEQLGVAIESLKFLLRDEGKSETGN